MNSAVLRAVVERELPRWLWRLSGSAGRLEDDGGRLSLEEGLVGMESGCGEFTFGCGAVGSGDFWRV